MNLGGRAWSAGHVLSGVLIRTSFGAAKSLDPVESSNVEGTGERAVSQVLPAASWLVSHGAAADAQLLLDSVCQARETRAPVYGAYALNHQPAAAASATTSTGESRA
jgi:hypothetical protein